jgi:hypothetical protein
MSYFKPYDFKPLLPDLSQSQITDCRLDMCFAALRLCPQWRGYWPGGDTLVEWLYNERPEIARTIERNHGLYPENNVEPLSYNHDFRKQTWCIETPPSLRK